MKSLRPDLLRLTASISNEMLWPSFVLLGFGVFILFKGQDMTSFLPLLPGVSIRTSSMILFCVLYLALWFNERYSEKSFQILVIGWTAAEGGYNIERAVFYPTNFLAGLDPGWLVYIGTMLSLFALCMVSLRGHFGPKKAWLFLLGFAFAWPLLVAPEMFTQTAQPFHTVLVHEDLGDAAEVALAALLVKP